MHWIDWLIVGLYSLSTLFIGLYFTKKASDGIDDFFVAGRSLGWFVVGTSMVATTFSVDTPLFVASISREIGVFENWLWWSSAMAGMAGVFFFAHLWRRSGVVTEVELISLRYPPSLLNDSIRIFKVFFEGIIMNCILMGGITIAVGKIIETILPETKETFLDLPFLSQVSVTTLLVFGLGVCAVIYSSLSGLYGVMYTDLIQFGFAMVGSVALAFVVYQQSSEGGLLTNLEASAGFDKKLTQVFPPFESFNLTTFTFIVYMTISWWGVSAGSGSMVQRLLSSRSEKDAVKGFFWYNICHYIIRPWPWIMVGLLSLIYLPNLQDSEIAFPLMVNAFLPVGLKGIMVASLFAAYMSTIDTHLNWGSSYIVNDFYKSYIYPTAPSRHYVKIARMIMLVIILIVAVVASHFNSILQIYKYVMLVGGGVGTVLIARWYWWRVNLKAELTAYVLSFILAPVLTLYLNDDSGSDYFAVRLVVITTTVTIAWVLVAIFTNKKPDRYTVEFHKKLKVGGRGWRKVAKICDVNGESQRIPIAILGWVLGCLMIYGFMLGIGKLLLLGWLEGGIYLLIGIISTILLAKIVLNKKML